MVCLVGFDLVCFGFVGLFLGLFLWPFCGVWVVCRLV